MLNTGLGSWAARQWSVEECRQKHTLVANGWEERKGRALESFLPGGTKVGRRGGRSRIGHCGWDGTEMEG